VARNGSLPDNAPATDENRTKPREGAAKPEWLVTVGVCTHLGCTPEASTARSRQGDYGGWLCHCHGSQYDMAGRVRVGPAPRNLDVPIFTYLSDTRIRVGWGTSMHGPTYVPKYGLSRQMFFRSCVSSRASSAPVPLSRIKAWYYRYRLPILSFFLGVQIVTGIVLAMHYTPDSRLAFDSVEHIMRDVNAGWMLRYLHSNGASMFFLAVYIHMFRGLYYGSQARVR
jgi:hypothetical protein